MSIFFQSRNVISRKLMSIFFQSRNVISRRSYNVFTEFSLLMSTLSSSTRFLTLQSPAAHKCTSLMFWVSERKARARAFCKLSGLGRSINLISPHITRNTYHQQQIRVIGSRHRASLSKLSEPYAIPRIYLSYLNLLRSHSPSPWEGQSCSSLCLVAHLVGSFADRNQREP